MRRAERIAYAPPSPRLRVSRTETTRKEEPSTALTLRMQRAGSLEAGRSSSTTPEAPGRRSSWNIWIGKRSRYWDSPSTMVSLWRRTVMSSLTSRTGFPSGYAAWMRARMGWPSEYCCLSKDISKSKCGLM